MNILTAGEETLGRVAVSMGHNGFMFCHLEKCVSVFGMKTSKCSKGKL